MWLESTFLCPYSLGHRVNVWRSELCVHDNVIDCAGQNSKLNAQFMSKRFLVLAVITNTIRVCILASISWYNLAK